MSKPLVTDALWALVAPFLPVERRKGGRPRIPDRAALTGIPFVLKLGIPWEMLPQQLGCGSGMTCWRRLRDWQHPASGHASTRRCCSACKSRGRSIGSGRYSTVRACRLLGGGEQTGKDPTNRGKLGTKRHVVVDRHGLPLAVTISGANVHDSKLLEETVDAIPALGSRTGSGDDRASGPRSCMPTRAMTTRGADRRCGRAASFRASHGAVSNRASDSAASAPVVERTLSWLNRFRRLKVRVSRGALTSIGRFSRWAAY
jgi:transposase